MVTQDRIQREEHRNKSITLVLPGLMLALFAMEAQPKDVPSAIQHECETRGAFVAMLNSMTAGGEQLPFSMQKCIDDETVASTQLAMLYGSHSDLIDLCVQHEKTRQEESLIGLVTGLRATEETAAKIHGSWMNRSPSYRSVQACVADRIDRYE